MNLIILIPTCFSALVKNTTDEAGRSSSSTDICKLSNTYLCKGEAMRIRSPNYPSNYNDGRSCTVTIMSEELMTVDFHFLHTEKGASSGNCYDYLRVDGKKFCGREPNVKLNCCNLNYIYF